eukprot:5079489-Lingulodinium_polyedra.AAC.1
MPKPNTLGPLVQRDPNLCRWPRKLEEIAPGRAVGDRARALRGSRPHAPSATICQPRCATSLRPSECR